MHLFASLTILSPTRLGVFGTPTDRVINIPKNANTPSNMPMWKKYPYIPLLWLPPCHFGKIIFATYKTYIFEINSWSSKDKLFVSWKVNTLYNFELNFSQWIKVSFLCTELNNLKIIIEVNYINEVGHLDALNSMHGLRNSVVNLYGWYLRDSHWKALVRNLWHILHHYWRH